MAKNTNWLVWLVVAGVAYFMFFGAPDFSGAGTSDDAPTTACGVEDVSFSPKLTRLGKAGTSLSTATYNYYITTDNLGTSSAASATTVPTNYAMQVMYGENSTTYYTLVKSVASECQDPFYDSVALALADTSLNSFYVSNSDGTVNSGSSAEAMGADDTFETTATIKAGSDEYYGNPSSDCQNVGVLEYDKTYILKVTGDNPTAVPGFFTYNNTNYDGANAFYIPKVGDGEKAEFNVKIESTSTQPDGTNQPILHVYDCDVDKNEDTLELIEGVEDEDLTTIALATQNVIVRLS